MKRTRHLTEPGEKRAARIIAERVAANRLPARWAAAKQALAVRTRSAVGLKRWFVPGSEFEGTGVLTPYAHKELRRRRTASRISKMARRRNRAR